MALGDSYATLVELKTRLNIADTIDDAGLTSALAVASRGIETCCDRQFNRSETASLRVYRPAAATWATVDDFYTTTDLAISTVTLGGASQSWTATDYELWPLNGIVSGQPGWPYKTIRMRSTTALLGPSGCDRTRIQVTARWGWGAVPAPVKEATLILAEDIFKLKDSPFGAGGYAEYGRIRARENPNVLMRISPYMRSAVLVA